MEDRPYIERTITKDEPLCDGTPRKHRGYIARLFIREHRNWKCSATLCTSKPLKTEREAVTWYPDVQVISYIYGFTLD